MLSLGGNFKHPPQGGGNVFEIAEEDEVRDDYDPEREDEKSQCCGDVAAFGDVTSHRDVFKEIVHLKPSTADEDDDAGDEGWEDRAADAQLEYEILWKAGVVAVDQVLEQPEHAGGGQGHREGQEQEGSEHGEQRQVWGLREEDLDDDTGGGDDVDQLQDAGEENIHEIDNMLFEWGEGGVVELENFV